MDRVDQKAALQVVLQCLFVVLIVAEVWLSLVPIDQDIVTFEYSDKVVHFLMHGFNVVFAALVFSKAGTYRGVLIFLLLLGPAIEVLQGMTESRTASVADGLANAAGFLVAYVLAPRVIRNG